MDWRAPVESHIHIIETLNNTFFSPKYLDKFKKNIFLETFADIFLFSIYFCHLWKVRFCLSYFLLQFIPAFAGTCF